MFFEVSGLTKRFGGLTAVADMSFSIARGEIVGIFGPNGSGKTTLLNLIAGIYPPTDGRLFWKDRPLDARLPHRVAELGIVKTFQNPLLFQELSVVQHVLIAAHLRLKRALGLRRIVTLLKPARYNEALHEQVERVLKLCRLSAMRDEPAASLSYGDEKMLGVAMALMCEPELLLLDEPATGLDPEGVRWLAETLRRLRDAGCTMLMSLHGESEISSLATRAIRLDAGAVVADTRTGGSLQSILAFADA